MESLASSRTHSTVQFKKSAHKMAHQAVRVISTMGRDRVRIWPFPRCQLTWGCRWDLFEVQCRGAGHTAAARGTLVQPGFCTTKSQSWALSSGRRKEAKGRKRKERDCMRKQRRVCGQYTLACRCVSLRSAYPFFTPRFHPPWPFPHAAKLSRPYPWLHDVWVLYEPFIQGRRCTFGKAAEHNVRHLRLSWRLQRVLAPLHTRLHLEPQREREREREVCMSVYVCVRACAYVCVCVC